MDVASVTTALASVALGLSAGALLAEGGLLVPFWRASSPEAFLDWYERHASMLMRFFTPVEVSAAGLALAAAALHWGSAPLSLAALLSTGLLAMFPLYFERANASFAKRTVGIGNVAGELRRWAAWHWCRTGIAITAFALAVIAN
jgi:hypothetical protein